MKIQISNFYNLSIILFILSGCQELKDLKIGEQILLDVIETNETKIETDEIKIEALETTEVETKKNVDLKKMNNLSVDYSYLSKLKNEIRTLIYFKFDNENKKIKDVLLDCFEHNAFSTFPYIVDGYTSKQAINKTNSGNCISLSMFIKGCPQK